MSAHPEALRLADALEISSNHGIRREAAAELRRLHAKCEALTEDTTEEMRRITELYRVTAQRDALLEALKTVEWHGQGWCWVVDADKIAAAIKAAEGGA